MSDKIVIIIIDPISLFNIMLNNIRKLNVNILKMRIISHKQTAPHLENQLKKKI